MSLLDQLRGRFTKKDRQRGASYFGADYVSDLAQTDDRVTARVWNGAGTIYQTSIDLEDGVPTRISCDCPRFDDTGACKHLWATVLQLCKDHGDTELAQTASSPTTYRKATSQNKEKRKPTPAWLASFNQVVRASNDRDNSTGLMQPGSVREHRIWYVITLNRNVDSSQLLLEFEQQVKRKNGEWGSIKPFAVDDRFTLITDPRHREAIDTINRWREALKGENEWGSSYYRYRQETQVVQWKVPPLAYDAVLPKVFETGGVRWRLDHTTPACDAHHLSWDERSWSFDVEVTTDNDTQEWVFAGRLKCGRESVPLDEAVLGFPEGLVMFSNRMARLDLGENARWLGVLQKHSRLRVPFADRDRFVKEFGTSAVFADLELPEELLAPATLVEPAARIRLKTVGEGRTRRVHGRIDFIYGDVAVRVNSSQLVVGSEESQVRYRRNLDAEARWLQHLPVDLRTYDGRLWGDERPDVDCLTGRMVVAVGDLLETGWDVEVEEQKVRRGGAASVSVSSEIDWFELQGEFKFEDTDAELPVILQAAKSGKHFVKLRDGSLGMLPQSWLEQNEDIISLGELNGDKVRFRPSQAMLLDSLLAAQTNQSADRKFKAFCRKLRSFDGIKPKSAPQTFKGKLREYQRDGLAWLNFLREYGLGGCLADDMGLGKTVQVLALLESRRTRRLRADEQRLPSLVVVPKSLVFNWIEEARRFAPNMRVGNYTGLDRKELLSSIDDYDLLVTTYGSTRIDIVDLQEIAFDYVILDESQAIKNANSQASKAVRLLNGRHRLALTGTPIENHLGELWSLFEFLNPGMLGRSAAFKKLAKRPRIMAKAAALQDGEEPNAGIDNAEVSEAADGLKMLAEAIRPYMLRRTKQQVLKDLPDKTEQTVFCELGPKQRKVYNKIRDFYRAHLTMTVKQKGLQQSKIYVLEALLRLRQVACHPQLIDSNNSKVGSAKLDMLDMQLEEIVRDGRKVLVFSQFTSMLSLVRDRLDKQGATYEYLDGKTTDRQAKVDRFQSDPDCSIFLISLKAGGSGLNLTAAEYVFILDPWWNPAVEAQAIDRAHRIGQENQVFAYRIIAKDTVEERILELQASKRNLADSIISADSSLISDLTAEDLQLLLS